MRKLFQGKLAILGLLVAFLSGCSSWHHVSIFSHGAEPVEESPDSPPPSVANAPAVSVPDPEPSLPIVSQPQISEIPPAISDISSQTANHSLLPSTLEDVFFDYDQYYIRSEAVPILMQNAEVLLNRHATRTVLIEGHCDERGTEEYNLILGERRAMAVKNYLVDLGVSASSIRTLSLGKNEPFCLQPTRECFQKNRRAHFVLK
ncbi:OmpA family protein [Candidatus Nitrospira allomarina]|uniref:Peptidoglycan-associated lipoprotein n=1 Tax=Candidatus Nitrospira allomarina TaxID=3020900 RepID=A0AA96G832_9BACT|nr:OmpA family protein [Candidatus Nitrospira allomarina]WNM56888.1 OmpA family protein [Candidatus Nitrospira allomarina]